MEKKTERDILRLLKYSKERKVLVIGDFIIDENVYCKPLGKVMESPQARKLEYLRTVVSYGGAGNVVSNILALGAKVSFITVLGDDLYSKDYLKCLNWKNNNLNFLPVKVSNRQTTVKTKFWSDRETALKVNRQPKGDISQDTEGLIINYATNEIDNSDIVLLVDYRHGMMTKGLISGLKSLVDRSGKKIIASSQISQSPSNHLDYKQVYMVCLNRREASAVDKDFNNLSLKLDSIVCITKGEQGSELYLDDKIYSIPAFKVVERDSTGAGDSFIAALSLIDIKKNPLEALYLANAWAALSVQQYGTDPPNLKDLKGILK